LLDRNHLVPLPRIRAGRTRVVEQHLVKVLAPHLVRMRRTVSNGASERERVVAALIVRLEVGTGLEHAMARTLSSTPSRSNNGRFIGSSDSPM
jgi:hypothetical protein